MADLTVSSAVDTFMQASTVAAMRTALDLDANYVNLSGTQTISGAKTFSSDLTMSSANINADGNQVILGQSGGDYIATGYNFTGVMDVYAGMSALSLYGAFGLFMPSLPTSNPFVTDQIWNDGGYLAIS